MAIDVLGAVRLSQTRQLAGEELSDSPQGGGQFSQASELQVRRRAFGALGMQMGLNWKSTIAVSSRLPAWRRRAAVVTRRVRKKVSDHIRCGHLFTQLY